MSARSTETQKTRLDNIVYAEKSVAECTRRLRVFDYLPGQVIYNLGPYPAAFSIKPTEYDYNLIKSLSENGVELIQVHEEWNDSIRVHGADKYSSHDRAGMTEFIELCHKFDIQIIPYISSGYIDIRDPDMRPEFLRTTRILDSVHMRYAHASLSSAQWCNYLYDKAQQILDRYDFDGLYNDMGYDAFNRVYPDGDAQGKGWVEGSNRPYDPEMEDMLARLYSLVKQGGGVMKLHYSRSFTSPAKDKVYDYLWVGEGVGEVEKLKASVRYQPYVVPCPDFQYTEPDDYEKFFALFLPLMQFPLRTDGRPFEAAKKLSAPGVDYTNNHLMAHMAKIADFEENHPDGPFIYSEWGSLPDNVEYRKRWFYYLTLYRPMVEEGNVAHIDIKACDFVNGPIPESVCISLFTGDEQYLCAANTGNAGCSLDLPGLWVDRETDEPVARLDLKPNRVRFLRKLP